MYEATNFLRIQMAALPGVSRILNLLGTRRYNRTVRALTGPVMRAEGIRVLPDMNTMLRLRRTINGWTDISLPIEHRTRLIAAGISPEAFRSTEYDVLDEDALAAMAALRPVLDLTPEEALMYGSLVGYVEDFMVKADYLRDPEMLDLLIGKYL